MPDTIKYITDNFKKSPSLLAIVLIIAGFLFYLFRHDSMELEKVKMTDRVSEQRIERCHDIQNKSNEVIDRLNYTLDSHNKAFNKLYYKMDSFDKNIEENNKNTERILEKIDNLRLKIDGLKHR